MIKWFPTYETSINKLLAKQESNMTKTKVVEEWAENTPEHFLDYDKLLKFLVKQGVVALDQSSTLESYLAAFENTQRRRGSYKAKEAMLKAAQKAW
jgi:hypothetical protein